MTLPHRAAFPALVASVLLALAGCGGKPTTYVVKTDSPTAVASPKPSGAPTEGPAGTPVRYPSGLVVTLAKLERIDPKLGYGLTAGDTLIKVSVTVQNSGSQPFELIHTWLWTVLYGPNRMDAPPVADADGRTGRVSSENPEQVAPGQTVTIFQSAAVPTGQLGDLAVKVDLDPSGKTATEYVFTGTQGLLR